MPRQFSINAECSSESKDPMTESEKCSIITVALFSVHISYRKGKYLNQTGFFYKSCQELNYILAKGFHL